MGTLADCLTKVGITGAKAKYITEQAAKWKSEGFDPQTAHVNAVKELLGETRKQQRSVVKQLQSKLTPEQLDAVFPAKKAEPADVQEDSLPDWVTEDTTAEATKLAPKQKQELSRIKRRLKLKLDKETFDEIAGMSEADQHAISIEADRRADAHNQYWREIIDDFNNLTTSDSIKTIATRVRNVTASGKKDTTNIPGFDLLVQHVESNLPSLLGYASSVGNGDVESGLHDIVIKGRRGLEANLVGPESHAFDVLEEYRERLERSPEEESGVSDSEERSAGFDDEPVSQQRDGGDAGPEAQAPATQEADLAVNESDAKKKGARRSRNSVHFDKPIKGPSGASLTSYDWKWMLEESPEFDEPVRVSDWSEAERNEATGRDVVHQFHVADEDGRQHVVSLETAVKMLGLVDGDIGASKVKNLAMASMQLVEQRRSHEELLNNEAEKAKFGYQYKVERSSERISELENRVRNLTKEADRAANGESPAKLYRETFARIVELKSFFQRTPGVRGDFGSQRVGAIVDASMPNASRAERDAAYEEGIKAYAALARAGQFDQIGGRYAKTPIHEDIPEKTVFGRNVKAVPAWSDAKMRNWYFKNGEDAESAIAAAEDWLSKYQPEYKPASQADDFQLSGEGSTDTSPIVEPYKVAEKDRLPPKRTKQRQPQLEGLPEDLDESVLEGQQGLFSANAGEQLQPSTPKVIVTPPKSQREIINALAKSLDIPIRFGRMKNRQAGGVFFRKQNLIQSKKANDVPVVTHEVGHKLDAMFGLSKDKSIRSELEVLGDPDTPGSRSSWTKSKTKAYKLGEGMAEFVRYWMTDPKKAKADAPNTYATFEAILDANKDLGDSMRQAQEDIRLWRTAQPQARLRSQISVGENPNKTRYTLSQLTRDVVDDLHYLRLATEDAKLGEPGLKPSQNPYLLARNLRGSYGMAATFIQNGAVDFNSKDVALGTSLEDALKPVGGRINDFRDWIVAKRAQELESQGRTTGLVKSDIDDVVERFAGDAEFEKAFADVKKWNDAVLQYSVDAGLVTPDSAGAIRKMNQDYVPFHRIFEVGAGEAPSNESTGKGSGLNPGKPGSLKRLKGSTRDIVDPLETMVRNAYAIITASEKSAISLAVADMAKLPNMGKWVEEVARPMEPKSVRVDEIIDQLADLGADVEALEKSADVLTFFRHAKRPPKGENTISVIRDGKPEFYRLNRYLHDTFEALDLDDAGKLIRIASAPAQVLRAGVTLEPGFNFANMMRDTIGAAVINKYGALPFETTIRGIAALVNNPQLVSEWAASGGRSSVEANYFDRAKMQQYLAERISKDLTPAERATIVAKSPLKLLRWMATTFEEATRIGEYQVNYNAMKKSGMADGEARRLAAFEARDRQDFAKGGAKTKILRHVAAFWNAQLQANVRLAQAFKERPVQTIAKGLAFVTIPKLIEQALNWDDEDYWQRPQWERDAFYMIPIGTDNAGHTRFLRIPIPFEIGVIFGTIPGRFLQWAKENDPESVKGIPGMFLKQTMPVPNPSGAVTIAELIPDQGYSYFRGREIVPDSMADMPKDLQWTEQTSTVAKKVGETFGVSPMKVDYLIESTTGGLGKVVMGKQVPGERFVTNPLANVGQPISDFYAIRDQLTKDAARIKATGEYSGLGPVMLSEFEEAAENIGSLRNKARETTDPIEKAKIDDEAYKIAVNMVDKYRREPESEEAVAKYSEAQAKRFILNSGRPHEPKKKVGENPADFERRVDEYNKNLQSWSDRVDHAEKWLRAHRGNPMVRDAIKEAAADIPPQPPHRPNKDGIDPTYDRRMKEWRAKYGKSAQLVESLK